MPADEPRSSRQTVIPVVTGAKSDQEPQVHKVNPLLEQRKPPRQKDGRIRIPLSGLVNLDKKELRVIDTESMQRLRKIRQLGGTYMVYPGAIHSRFEHSLGTLDMVQRMLSSLGRNYLYEDLEVSAEQVRVARMSALVHDIGHLPYGHTLEDEVGIFVKHDDEKTLSRFLSPEHPVGEIIGSDRQKVAAVLSKNPTEKLDKNEVFLADLVANTVCADLLDYLRRDFYHLGFRSDYDDHIFEYLTLCKDKFGRVRLAIDYMRGGKPRPDAISIILQILELRYMLAESVLFHHAKDCHSAMLARAVLESCFLRDRMPAEVRREAQQGYSREEGNQVGLYFGRGERISGNVFVDLGDDELVACIAEDEDWVARALGTRVRDRHLYNLAMRIGRGDAERSGSLSEIIEQTHNQPYQKVGLERQIERDLGLPRGSVLFYTPSSLVQHKVAKVHVVVDDTAEPLIDLEERTEGKHTGGFLAAQVKRFKGLWRSYVFTNPALTDVERESVKKYVRAHFGLHAEDPTAEGRRKAFAEGFAELAADLVAHSRSDVDAGELATARRSAVEVEARGKQTQLAAALAAIEAILSPSDDE